MKHILRLALVVALVAGAACGGRQDPPALRNAGGVGLPDAVPAVPAYVMRFDSAVTDARIRRAQEIVGVAVAAPVARRAIKVVGPRGTLRLDVAAVDPLQFRAVAPQSTEDSDFVWTSLLRGSAVLTFDAARRLGFRGSGEIDLGQAGHVTVGAVADNAAPNLADVLLSRAALPGARAARVLVIGAASGATIEVLGRNLADAFPGAHLRRIRADVARPARGTTPEAASEGSVASGVLNFTILKNGYIAPDPAWVSANIASGTVPILGLVTCHRIMFGQLRGALAAIAEEGLSDLIRTEEYAGCFVPRFIDRDPSKPLSMHAFGLAIDINTLTNRLGTRGDMDPRVVAIFERWGFEWGGRWARPDPMHFELARLITP